MNPLKPLATEELARKHNQRHRDVDAPACRDRFPGDSEHRRLHDALMRKKQIGSVLLLIAVGLWLGLCLAMQA